MKDLEIKNKTVDELLTRFNNRDSLVFTNVYIQLIKPLYLYASKLYSQTNIEPEDAVQDAFVHIWESKNLTFESFVKLKSYAIVYIKNRFLKHLEKQIAVHNYQGHVKAQEEFAYDTFESEVYSLVDEFHKILPSRYARTIEMLLKGYKPEEIAKELNCNTQTIYNNKRDAIEILRNKLNRNSYSSFLLITLLGL